MSTDARWTIGTGIAIATLLATLMVSQHGGLDARLNAIEARLENVEARLLSIEEHLRSTPPSVPAPDSLPKHR